MVDGDQYVERVCSVVRQFEMVRDALTEFGNNTAKQDRIAEEAVASFLRSFQRLLKKSSSFEDRPPIEPPPHPSPAHVVYGIHSEHEHVRKQLKELGDDAKATFVGKTQEAMNRVNQNELILLVALFETQMKEIHRGILRQKPELLQSNRQVPLGRLIDEGLARVLDVEIEREVRALDRRTISQRVNYFRRHLQLDLGAFGSPEVWEETIRARNQLLYEDPDLAIPSDSLAQARNLALIVPFRCCEQCVQRYPEGFQQWDGWLTTDWSKYDLD